MMIFLDKVGRKKNLVGIVTACSPVLLLLGAGPLLSFFSIFSSLSLFFPPLACHFCLAVSLFRLLGRKKEAATLIVWNWEHVPLPLTLPPPRRPLRRRLVGSAFVWTHTKTSSSRNCKVVVMVMMMMMRRRRMRMRMIRRRRM